MVVTEVEEVTKSRYKVYLDDQFAFVLYKGELSRYHLKQDEFVDQLIVEQIKKEVIFKRAKKRVLYLLERMPRTEMQLREKLRLSFYTEDIIDVAIEYAKSFSYIDDENYARNYIEMKRVSKSKKELRFALIKKSVNIDILEKALEDAYEEKGDIEAIERYVSKKKYDIMNSSDKEKQKMYAYLMRKGFSYGDICQVLRVSERNA